ncbi:zinc ribbon domain-containing protein [Arcanobacterium ihumii]|uniref:zinc ribbon domain-containing protein n=1 Tax=Arcanobacterium ihumii TaxID=2138162 RepID=UPI000F541F2B|nr:hypothetical protein [Arcanobacterium ihumii]
MVKAPREQQLKLIEVAQLDAQLARLNSKVNHHPMREELHNLDVKQEEALASREDFKTRHDGVNAQNDELDRQVHEVLEKIHSKETKLNAGVGMDSRELLALQSEIDTARKHLHDLEDAQLNLLDDADQLESRIGICSDEIEQLQRMRAEVQQRFTAELATLNNEITKVSADRDGLFKPLDEALQRAYEGARSRGGLSVIGLHHNGESTGGVALSPIEVAAVKAGAEDEIYISEDYDCVVVLLDN